MFLDESLERDIFGLCDHGTNAKVLFLIEISQLMKVKIESTKGKLNFKGTNSKGHEVLFSGDGNHASPMEVLLMSAAACSCIDVEIFLEKMRQELERVEVEVIGDRPTEGAPRPFNRLHLTYHIYGDVKEKKAHQAVTMAVEKYCSVLESLDKNIEVKFDIVL